MIKLEDVQRGYDAWAAKPHNAKWVRKIDGTPIQNDIVVSIFDALKAIAPQAPVSAVPVAWVIPGQDNARSDGALDAMAWREGEFTVPLYASPPPPAQADDGKDAEIAKLKAAIAWANNSLFGSHGFFLSLNGGADDEHHLDLAIEDLKGRNGKADALIRELVAALADRDAEIEHLKLEMDGVDNAKEEIGRLLGLTEEFRWKRISAAIHEQKRLIRELVVALTEFLEFGEYAYSHGREALAKAKEQGYEP